MRRLIPWALLGLLTVGAAVGVVLGVAGHSSPSQSPAQWVTQALAATAQAGTARVTYRNVTSSANADLRGTQSGSGTIDFARRSFHVEGVSRNISFQGGSSEVTHAEQTTQRMASIGVRSDLFIGFASPVAVHWSRATFPRSIARSELGLSGALSAGVALSSLDGPPPVAAVRQVGAATVAGVPTTKYVVTFAPLPRCGRPRHGPPAQTVLPTTVWIDARGRLAQVRAQFRDVIRPLPAAAHPAFVDMPTGRTLTTAVLRFTDFGAPVTIEAPSLPPSSGTGFGATLFATARCH